MARSAKIYDFTIPANGSFTLLVEGSYYRILSSTGSLEVRRDGGSGVGPIYAGQGERDEEFKRITLVDKTGAINSGYIIISDGTFVDDRITGEVSVIDGGKARTIANSSYCSVVTCAGTATNYSHVQIWNPVGSGKNVIVEAVNLFSPTAAYLSLNLGSSILGVGIGNMQPKKALGSVSTAQTKKENKAAVTSDSQIWLAYVAATQTQAIKFNEPIALTPGSGLTATAEELRAT